MKRARSAAEASGGTLSGVLARLKKLKKAELVGVIELALRKEVLRPAGVTNLIDQLGSSGGAGGHGAAAAAAPAAAAGGKQQAAVDALTDPSTLTEITIGMAEQMDDMIRADWHDGWEEQNVAFCVMMGEFELLLAAANMACTDGKHARAAKACFTISEGLRDLFDVFEKSRCGPVYDALHMGGACEGFAFPQPPPNYNDMPDLAGERKHVEVLRSMWASRKPANSVDTGCIHRTLAMIWLTAVLEPLSAAKGGAVKHAQQAAVAALGGLVWFADHTRTLWKGNGYRPQLGAQDPNPLLEVAKQLGYDKKKACWQALQQALAAPKGDGVGRKSPVRRRCQEYSESDEEGRARWGSDSGGYMVGYSDDEDDFEKYID